MKIFTSIVLSALTVVELLGGTLSFRLATVVNTTDDIVTIECCSNGNRYAFVDDRFDDRSHVVVVFDNRGTSDPTDDIVKEVF